VTPSPHATGTTTEDSALIAVCLLSAAVAAPVMAVAVVVVLLAALALGRVCARILPGEAGQLSRATAIVVYTGVVSAAAIAADAGWPSLQADPGAAWAMLAACGLLLAPRLRMRQVRTVAIAGGVLLACSLLVGLMMSLLSRAPIANLTHLVAPWLRDAMAAGNRPLPAIVVPATFVAVGLVLALRNRLAGR